MPEVSLKRAAMINACARYSRILLQIVFNGILARILSPEDYGKVAVITVFTTLFTTISDMGVGPAVIQNKELNDEEINDIFTFTLWVGFLFAVVFAVLSGFLSSFYGDPQYVDIGRLLSLSVAFQTWNMIPNAILMRNKKFISTAIRTVTVYVTVSVATIFMAIQKPDCYALVYQAILTAAGTFIWNFLLTRPRPVLLISGKSIQKIFTYSLYQFCFDMINYLSRNLDNLLIGKFFGSAELGYYDKAYKLMLYPVNNLTGAISPVLHPILSDYQKEKDQIYKKYCKVVKLLALAGVFTGIFCYFTSEEIIGIVYGPKWGMTVRCFHMLSISVAAQMVTSSAGAVFQSIGNTRLLFFSGTINACITILAIVIGVRSKSLEMVAFLVAMAYLWHFILSYFLLVHYGFGKKIRGFYWELRQEFAIAILLIVAGIVFPFHPTQMVSGFIVKVLYFGIIYLAGIRITGEHRMLYASLFRGKNRSFK